MNEYRILESLKKRILFQYDYTKPYSVGVFLLDKKGNILSFGQNSYFKSHPKQKRYASNNNPNKVFLHGEIDALIRCRFKKAHTMMLCRITKTGMIKLAKPCEGCLKAIIDSEIKRVYYTNNYGELILLDMGKI